MKRRTAALGVGLAIALAVGLLAARQLSPQGNTDSASVPANTASYTLDDVYDRLETGAVGAQSTFTEPVAPPGTGTMHTIDEIMEAIPALVDNGDETVTDRITGLMWTKDSDHGTMLEAAAEAYCTALRTGGHDDWRLPMAFEISTLLDKRRSNPALRLGHPFEDVFVGHAYRTNSWALEPGTYLILNLSGGDFAWGWGDEALHVWPVRDP